jgi:hypothetical protein
VTGDARTIVTLVADAARRMRAFEGNYRAALTYQPGRFDGPMILITAADNDATGDVTGWAALAPALEHRTTRGDHYSTLRPPHLTTLAVTLRDAMDRTGPGQRAEIR